MHLEFAIFYHWAFVVGLKLRVSIVCPHNVFKNCTHAFKSLEKITCNDINTNKHKQTTYLILEHHSRSKFLNLCCKYNTRVFLSWYLTQRKYDSLLFLARYLTQQKYDSRVFLARYLIQRNMILRFFWPDTSLNDR